MRKLALLLAISILMACSSRKQIDLLVYNAQIYTVDSLFSQAEAMAIKDGKIVAIGNKTDLTKEFEAKDSLDAQGKSIYPGFIDGHAHFLAYGQGLQTVDLVGTQSWAEIVEKVKNFAVQNPEGWILGRGWDQNDWADKRFPSNEQLNQLFPIVRYCLHG